MLEDCIPPPAWVRVVRALALIKPPHRVKLKQHTASHRRLALHFLLIPMRYSLCVFILGASAVLCAQTNQVSLAPELAVNLDGKPFTIFHFGMDANKPFLSPLRSASGKIIT